MSRRTGKDRPDFVKCRCGADIPVKTGGGPLPSICKACRNSMDAARMSATRRGTYAPPVVEHNDMSGWGMVESDYVELMRRERAELGCKFDSFRAAVQALARDMNLGRVA